jgi:SAM-dependent methyltransferase
MNLEAVYRSLLAADPGYATGHHWRPMWPAICETLAGGGSLLDVGCGRGGLVLEGRAMGWTAEGCDLAPCQPWIARAALPRLPYATAQFDLVGCFDVLEHLPEADVPAACAELVRVCKRRLIISVAECSDPRMVDGVEVELHLTRRPVTWWQDQFDVPSRVLPAPGQPDWRTYLDIPLGA